MTVALPLDQLQLARSVWPREIVNRERVELFVSLLQSGAELPSIEVVRNGHGYLVADGVHRVLATRSTGRPQIVAEIVMPAAGESPSACAYRRALETAARSALPLTKAERRAATVRLLHERPDLSHREIAKLVGVSHDTIDRWAREAAESATGPSATPSPGRPSSFEMQVRRMFSLLGSINDAANERSRAEMRKSIADVLLELSPTAVDPVRRTG